MVPVMKCARGKEWLEKERDKESEKEWINYTYSESYIKRHKL